MKAKLTLLTFLIALMSMAQSGINYKALIKDTNGNVIANQGIDMVFSIQIQGNTVYSELQQIITDDNGIAIATIGVGSVITGVFNTITWELGDTELNVQIDFGDGLVDFGNSPFNAVPYAINTLRPQGLETINEGGSQGWRIAHGIDPENYGNIGSSAVDLSFQPFVSDRGATGLLSFSSGGYTEASGSYSSVFGEASRATGLASFAAGSISTASGDYSVSLGRETVASGDYSLAIGFQTQAQAYATTAVGRYNVGGGNPNIWNANETLFEIGNGSSSSNRRNALTVDKQGSHTINSDFFGLIVNAEAIGISIPNPGGTGLTIQDPEGDGVFVFGAENYGANVSGTIAGIRASVTNWNNPDIILAGNFGGSDQDDGILSSDPQFSSSDLYFKSNDAIVLELDDDNNESGTFIIRNGADNTVFTLNESGDLNLNGLLTIGDETIEDTGSNQLSFGGSLIPSNNNAYRLGNSTSRWIGVWATDGTINTSDRREKENIQDITYGLEEVLQMSPVSFNWKHRKEKDKKLGLIAQDLLKLVPEVVKTHDWKHTSNDENAPLEKVELDRLGVYYSDLIPVLINAIKEQNEIIKNQAKALKTSENNYEALLSRIEILESKSSN